MNNIRVIETMDNGTEMPDYLLGFYQKIEDYDPDTAIHCKRVAKLCRDIGNALSYRLTEKLCRAAIVHDIGKILIPREVLCKPDELSDYDKMLLESHARNGYEILGTGDVPEIEKQLVLYHHGFTSFPVKYEINSDVAITKSIDNDLLEGSLIIQACDIYDAVTTNRPYHQAKSGKVAIEALKEKHVPKTIVDYFGAIA